MKHILFVDDSAETRELVQMIFKLADEDGVVIDYAMNSREAIDLFNINAYNACVLDVSLPDLTGYYLGKLIRESCPDMPIAFLTNYEGDLTKENAEDIEAVFWAKSEVFENPIQLKGLISELSLENACEAHEKIEMPEIIKEINE
jgi:CheY-like chemotaxis protein